MGGPNSADFPALRALTHQLFLSGVWLSLGLSGACATPSALEDATVDLDREARLEGREAPPPIEARPAASAVIAAERQGAKVAKPSPAPAGAAAATPSEAPAPAPKVDPRAPWEGSSVSFDGEAIYLGQGIRFDGEALAADAQGVVDELVTLLGARESIAKLECVVHTHGKVGAKAQGLTDARAQTLQEALIGRGVDPARIAVSGAGDTMPIDTNRTEEGRRANERVEVQIVQWAG